MRFSSSSTYAGRKEDATTGFSGFGSKVGVSVLLVEFHAHGFVTVAFFKRRHTYVN